MNITVRLGPGVVSDLAQKEKELVIELPVESTAGDLLRTLQIKSDENFLIVINGRASGRDTKLADGDRVTLVYAVIGG